ncbi:MAG: SAM-dependent methyltransferase [Clostridiales bacterium]|nr:SAM-dependent methyltransferase [Clostridiales bacterium]
MSYSKRIDVLCSLLTAAETFADVGCDHGYCSEYMLSKGLCKKAILSDISKGSLAKAERLLAEYIQNGKAVSVLGDGFYGVPSNTDEVLIAGMGGSEIVDILSDKKYGFIPKRFVFQPMHDAEKLRRYILDNSGYIERDFTFEDVKFYDVIVGGKAEDKTTEPYTDAEYEYGRENLQTMPKAFIQRTQKQLKNTNAYLSRENLQEESRAALEEKRKRLEGVLSGEIK